MLPALMIAKLERTLTNLRPNTNPAHNYSNIQSPTIESSAAIARPKSESKYSKTCLKQPLKNTKQGSLRQMVA